MDLGTPPKLGGETLNSLIEQVNHINQEMFPLLDQEGCQPLRYDKGDGVVEVFQSYSFWAANPLLRDSPVKNRILILLSG